ncbi:MAG: serine/threonine protein kinase [Pyrinomonadaceae bacterium]|nr:serine/threonine protein kinase [Pyrinomonadaceae bacterium]
MTPNQWQNIKKVFEEVCSITSSEELVKILNQRELSDEELDQIKRMVENQNLTFLDKSAIENAANFLIKEYDDFKGRRIGHFYIESIIGVGGMGIVYKAKDEKLRRNVAIKILPSQSLGLEQFRQFENEAIAASALNHPNIITVHEIGQEISFQYIVTEFIEGETLRDKLNNEQLGKTEVINIAINIAEALNIAHENEIIHRDIKPENIMIHYKGFIKVVDFGLAHFSHSTEIENQQFTLTKINSGTSQVLGTFRYMSPEQLLGETLNKQTDIWSLGIVIYEMLFGQIPFEWNSEMDIKEQLQNSYLSIPNAPQTDDFKEILRKSISKNKDNRYQNISDLLNDLKLLKSKYDQEIQEDLIRTFVGEKYDYYKNCWNGKKISNNLACLAFGPVWMGYRKMYLWAISLIMGFFIIANLISYFSLGELLEKVRWTFFPTFTIVANRIYENHVKTKILEIKSKGLSKQEELMKIQEKGGTSYVGAIFIVLLFGVVAFFSQSNLLINIWSSEPTSNSQSDAIKKDKSELEKLYLEASEISQQMLNIETSKEFAPTFIFPKDLTQTDYISEVKRRTALQKNVYEQYVSMNNKLITTYDKIINERQRLKKTELPSQVAGVDFLRSRHVACVRYERFLQDILQTEPLTEEKIQALQTALDEELDSLSEEILKKMRKFTELNSELQRDVINGSVK